MHNISIETLLEVPQPVNSESIGSLVDHILKQEGIDESWSVGIQFVDDPTMQTAHVEFMNIDEPTDIMTFPYADDDDVWDEGEIGGDLMISVDRAAANAREVGWSDVDELFFLIAHGLLHLIGWDDHTEIDRTNMLNRQRDLLESWIDRPSD